MSIALGVSESILGNHGVCRVHGGGFAGTIQIFVENSFVEEYRKAMDKVFGSGSCHDGLLFLEFKRKEFT